MIQIEVILEIAVSIGIAGIGSIGGIGGGVLIFVRLLKKWVF
jgi:hypothetical protein